MNSALQCLSNTFALTKYFLERRFMADINTTNILGSKGKLAKEYANLLTNLWFNTNETFSPYLIKSRVSDRNQMVFFSLFLFSFKTIMFIFLIFLMNLFDSHNFLSLVLWL